jgi:hypothetical protein
MTVTVDGVVQEENLITLLDNNTEHNVLVTDNKNM